MIHQLSPFEAFEKQFLFILNLKRIHIDKCFSGINEKTVVFQVIYIFLIELWFIGIDHN